MILLPLYRASLPPSNLLFRPSRGILRWWTFTKFAKKEETLIPIHPLLLGFSVAFLLEGKDGLILVDAGLPGSEGLLWTQMRVHGFAPGDLRLVILTHAHLDHCGCLPAVLRESGALLAAHPQAASRLQGGPVLLPEGRRLWGKTMAASFRLFRPWLSTPRLEIGLVLEDGAGLEDWGLPARILHTPGHTADSLSLLLEDGTALVGDLVVGWGRWARPQPYFIEDEQALAASIARLWEKRPRRLYASHWRRPLRLREFR